MVMIFFWIFSSHNLPKEILTGSPSLIWLVSDSGDDKSFRLLLKYLNGNPQIPDPDSGGTTVLEIALSKGHDKILAMIMRKSLYSR